MSFLGLKGLLHAEALRPSSETADRQPVHSTQSAVQIGLAGNGNIWGVTFCGHRKSVLKVYFLRWRPGSSLPWSQGGLDGRHWSENTGIHPPDRCDSLNGTH